MVEEDERREKWRYAQCALDSLAKRTAYLFADLIPPDLHCDLDHDSPPTVEK